MASRHSRSEELDLRLSLSEELYERPQRRIKPIKAYLQDRGLLPYIAASQEKASRPDPDIFFASETFFDFG